MRSQGAEFHRLPEAGTINMMMMHEVIAKKGMNELSQQLEGKAYRDFVAPHLETQLRLYVDVGYAAFAAK